MTQIEYNVKALVKRITQDENMRGYCFVKGFSRDEIDSPLESYMIAVSTLDTQVSTQFVGENASDNFMTSVHNATLKFRVYAPKNDGGDGLTSVVYELCQAIKRCDIQNVCEEIKTLGIAFDADSNTIYRDVEAKLSFCLCEEVAR